MMTLLYLLLLPMLSGIGMLGLGPALMAGRAGAAHVVLLLSGLLLPLRGLMYLLLARRRGNRPGRMSVLLAAVELLLGAGLLLLPQLSVRLFAVVVAVYLTLLVTVEASAMRFSMAECAAGALFFRRWQPLWAARACLCSSCSFRRCGTLRFAIRPRCC